MEHTDEKRTVSSHHNMIQSKKKRYMKQTDEVFYNLMPKMNQVSSQIC